MTAPATPLPSIAFSPVSGELCSREWRGKPLSERLTNDEKREVMRRANVYPRLVQALRIAASQLGAENVGAFELLKELGEAQ